MVPDAGINVFSTPGPYEDVVRSVRAAIEKRRLRIVSELDVSRRIEKTLGIRLPPCRILFVWPDPALAADVYPVAAIALPLHVVVASRGAHSEIRLQGRIRPEQRTANDLIRSAVVDTQAELMQSLETVAMHLSLV
jgi:uncharacterized protein (DUF302 family)